MYPSPNIILLIKLSRMRGTVNKLSMPYPVIEPFIITWLATVRAKTTYATAERTFKTPKWLSSGCLTNSI
jgi:hypothetical protein